MLEIIDKQTRARLFRERMGQALTTVGLSRSALARQIRTDRSTISQLLSDEGARLPNAQIVGACAQVLGVSTDWLLGLSDRPESASDLLATSLTLTQAPRALVDETIFEWHREAQGYKIRHVPAALPDMLKTRAVLEWEYSPHLGKTTTQAINASSDRLAWMQNARSDYEIAVPLYEIASFVQGVGYYEGLSRDARLGQVDHLLDLCDRLYPRLRIYLFDARRLYSAPVTLFGPLLAVLYVGRNYMTFRDTERVTALTAHFDNLVREASVAAHAFPDHLRALAANLAKTP